MMNRLVLCLLLGACSSSSGDLDPDVVTSLPPGDATGSALTGSYRMESLTTGCSGQCSTRVDDVVYSACDIGTREDDTVDVTQTNGVLQIDVDSSDYVSRLAGGVDASGTFDIGGLRTQLGGQVQITARATGTFAGETMTGEVRLRVTGHGLDCLIETDLTGTRR